MPRNSLHNRFHYENGDYVVILDGKVIWESSVMETAYGADAARVYSEEIRLKNPGSQLFVRVNGQ